MGRRRRREHRRDPGPVPCSEPADAFCVDQNAFTVNFFDRARDPQQPPLTDVQLDALPPAPKAATDKAPADPTQLKAFEDAQSEARSRIAASAATLPHGTDQPLARRVTLTVTDRSGRQGRRDFSFPVRPRAAPAPAVQVKQVGGNAVQGGKVYDPIAADPVPGNGRGTEVSLDLSRTTADPRGEIAFHVLEIGHPSVAPCDPKKAGAGCKQVDVQKNADLKRTPQDPVVRTLVVPGTTKAVSLTFPKPSGGVPWSILDTVYDETGDSRRLRLDGFEVLGQPKDCSTLSGFNLDQGNTAVDATCAYVGANAKLVMTAQPITLNGARLRAEPGLNLVLNRCAKAKAVVYATSAALAAASKGCDGPPVAVGTKLQLLLDDKPAATLGPITQADVDERKVPTTRLAKATYQRFDLRAGSDPDVALRDKGASTTTFFLTYPDVFASPEGDPAADAVAVRGVTVPKELVIAPFTGSVDAKAQAARARLRALSDAGPTVLSVPDGLSLGGIPIPPTTFTLDDKTGVFSAEAEVKIPLLPSAVKIRIRLRNGAFELAEGQFDADVPIGTFKLTSFKFRIERVMDEKTGKPVVELEAKVGFADASGALIEGTGGITVRPSPFYLKVEAQATIIKLLPVSAMIQVFGSDGFSFAGDLAKSFGPVSVTAHVDGEFGAGGFNVEGGGEACLFACLGAKALVSSDAIAACGSLKLFFVKLQAGFGFRYASGLDVFVGSCDLSPYRAKNVIQTRAVGVESPTLGARYGWDIGVGESAMSVVSAYATPGEPTLLGSTPSVALLHDGVEMARTTAFLGDYFQDPGSGIVVDQDPQVGVTRFLVPNPGAGGWSVQTLDKDRPIQFPVYSLADPPLEPELFTTRKVRKPSKGRLKAVMSGKEPLRGAIQPVSGVRGITKADRIQAGWAPSTALVAQGRAATRQATPGVAGTLAGQLIPTVPDLNALVTAGVPATMTMTGTRVPVEAVTDFQEGELAQFDFAAPRLPPGTRATFVEQGAHCHQQLGEAITPADGVLKGSLVFTPCRANDTFAGGPVALPHHDVVVRITNRLDQPRGSITLTSFPFKDPKALPKLPKLKARYLAKAGKLVLDPGEPYYLGDEPWVDVQVDAGPWRSSFPLTDALVQQLKAQQVGGGRKARAAAAVRRRSTRTQDWSFTLDGLPRGLRGVEVRLTRPRPEGAPASFAIGRTTMVRPEAERGGKRGGRPAGRRAGRR